MNQFLSKTGAMLLCTTFFATQGLAESHSAPDRSDDIQLLVIANIKEGQDAAFETLMADMVASTEAETGTFNYEWQRSGNLVHLQDRYDTNEDVLVHMQTFGENFGARFTEVFEVTGLTVYGPASEAVRGIFDPFGAVYLERVGGFSR